ncbi:response regulator [Brevibacterium album]|uniref:response regulator transcription factor n=1 Tax=Brevibacterium album TaxID=417948 RepID=UPI00041412E1|nr:response regulator [Brevibacterium album]
MAERSGAARTGPDRPLRLLIVDDDPGARALHARFAAGLRDFVVADIVGTGAQAIARAGRGDIDLVLLDLRLPDVSGIEVIHRLRTLTRASPDVMVISSSQDRITVRQALAGRVAGYLVKPFTYEAFAERLAVYREERRRPGAEPLRETELAQEEIDRMLAPGAARPGPREHGSAPAESPPAHEGSARAPAPGRSGAGGGAADDLPVTGSPGPLPKGISEVTLAKVLAALDPVVARSTAEVAHRCAVSRATARRYLDHLVTAGRADLAHRYGKRGRPEVLYRLVAG